MCPASFPAALGQGQVLISLHSARSLSLHVYCSFRWNVFSSPVILASSWLPAFGARQVHGILAPERSVRISVVMIRLGSLSPFSCLAPLLDCEPLESNVCVLFPSVSLTSAMWSHTR